MDSVGKESQRLSGHRYSIRQLLALSETNHNPFDLSKFSFDAARAGVIPSLGDCATASRKSSATQPCMPWLENVSIAPENRKFSSSTEIQVSDRDPQPPPVTISAQQHGGFARFLKKHSSPTHRRVTAGGRVVPMEPRPAPPPFSLATDGQAWTSKSRSNELHTPSTLPANNSFDAVLANKLETRPFPICKTPSTANPFQPALIAQNPLLKNDWESQPFKNTCPIAIPSENLCGQQHYTGGFDHLAPPPLPTLMPGNPASYGWWQTPCLVPNGMYSSTSNWPCTDATTPFGAQLHYNSPAHLTQPIIWAQNALADWSQRYNDLDQQLKALDRHRAMTSLTQDIANQRRKIVQQRSDSKNMISLISTWLNLSERVQPAADVNASTPIFNVNAPSYVPYGHNVQPTNNADTFAESAPLLDPEITIQKPPPRSVRRPITIKPPPMPQTDESPTQKQEGISHASPGQDEVDPWGVKIGPAPLELRRQQSEMLESIGEVRSESSPSTQSQESMQAAPAEGFFPHKRDKALAEFSAAHELKEGGRSCPGYVQAPAIVQNMYEEGLDALCKPRDTISTIMMPNGPSIDIEGQNLKCPELAHMSDLEQRYWLRKLGASHDTGITDVQQSRTSNSATIAPKITDILEESKGHPDEDYPDLAIDRRANGKENVAVTPIAHRKAATDLFLARFNDAEAFENVAILRPSVPGSHDASPAGRSGAGKLMNRSDTPFVETASMHESRLADIGSTIDPGSNMKHISNRSVFNNKGYSSTLVQNVNAIAQLPQNLDGAVDNGRAPKLVSSLANKVKSPRLLRRTTASGSAWYGPHCRQVIERALVNDDDNLRAHSP